ncbi:TolC family protein [Parafilimonas sp.]|uniref:TolC family protein n=1 Tax=Parafilimonas sp. TaxID=1969739 RepID=UPI0039E6242D
MRKLIFLILAGLIYFDTASAQDSTLITTDTAIWDLATCLDYAQKNNITINTLRLDSKYNEQTVIAAKAAKYPNLTGSVTQGLTHYSSSGLNASSAYGASSSVTLYNGGYINNSIKSAQLSLEASNLDIEAAKNDITLSITEAYLNILLAKENVVYYQDLINTTAAIVTQAQQRFDTGMVAKKDLLEAQATLASDKYSLVAAQNTVRQNILTLKQILQLPTAMLFNVSSKDSVTAVSLVTGLNEAQQLALSTMPEVKSSQLGVAVQQTEVEKAKYSLRPSLSLDGGIGTSYASSGKYFTQINNNFYQGLGLTLSVPIFDRKVTKTNVEKAKINVDIAKLDLQNTKTTLTQAVEQAYINVENAQQQYIAANEQLAYTQESFRIANEQLRIGSYSLVDYLQQKNLYVQAMQAYIQAKYSSALYTKIYNFYTGVPVTQ